MPSPEKNKCLRCGKDAGPKQHFCFECDLFLQAKHKEIRDKLLRGEP